MSALSGGGNGHVNFLSYLIQSRSVMIHADIRALQQYWQELRSGRICPFRAEVDPRDIRSRIGNLFILEDLGQENIRFRIAGTTLVDSFGIDLRGMPVRSIMEVRARRSFTELLSETMAEPGVGYARLRRAGAGGELWEIILLPLRSEHGRIDRVLGALHSLDPAATQSATTPLSFTVEEMAITPVAVERSDHAVQGFASGSEEFIRPLVAALGGRRPSLVAIEGGRVVPEPDKRGEESARGRPSTRERLRVVSDD